MPSKAKEAAELREASEAALSLLESIDESGAMTQALAWREMKLQMERVAKKGDLRMAPFAKKVLELMGIVYGGCERHHESLAKKVAR